MSHTSLSERFSEQALRFLGRRGTYSAIPEGYWADCAAVARSPHDRHETCAHCGRYIRKGDLMTRVQFVRRGGHERWKTFCKHCIGIPAAEKRRFAVHSKGIEGGRTG